MEATPATLPPPQEIFSGRVFLLPYSGRGEKVQLRQLGAFASLSPSDDDAHSLLLTNRVTRPTYNDRVEGHSNMKSML